MYAYSLGDNPKSEADMNSDVFVISIRNILLLQMVVMTLYCGYVVTGRLAFISIWRSIWKPLLPNITKDAQKGKTSFWEIDMTKL